MSFDTTNGRALSPSAPAMALAAVTPDDAADLPRGLSRGLYVAGAGAVTLMDAEGGVVTLQSADTQYHPVRVRRVLAAGTTATGMVALY